MKILVLDNYDSFTYNLVHLVKEIGFTNIKVFRNDKIDLEKVKNYDKILLSPGPGIPSEAGILQPLIREYAKSKSIFGVCLGHQAIGEVFGGKLTNLSSVFHGLATTTKITDVNELLFKDMPTVFKTGRYHSWVIDKNNFPNESLTVTATDETGEFIMALSHKKYDIRGVQFHPESVLTEHGAVILKNWLTN